MKKRYFWESVGECVSQTYEIDANNWEEAKRLAFEDMVEGDHIAECSISAIIDDGDYSYIDEDKCTEYATLSRGVWGSRTSSGREYWESRAWFFDDAPETYLNGKYEEFDAWEEDEQGGNLTK